MELIITIVYIIFLLFALVYAAVIIFNMLKYQEKSLSSKIAQGATKAIWVYVIISVVVLITSIAAYFILTI